jgi:hypothetical protein
MGVLGYVVLPMYFPNIAAMDGKRKKANILCLWIEFQVVEQCAVGYLIGRDATKAYKFIIDEELGHINVPLPEAKPFQIPITETPRKVPKQVDSRVFAAEAVTIRPRTEEWIPIRYSKNLSTVNKDLLATPIRRPETAENIHASACYSILSPTTTHLLYLNPSNCPVKVSQGEVITTVQPFTANTPYSYLNINSFTIQATSVLATTTNTNPSTVSAPAPQNGGTEVTTIDTSPSTYHSGPVLSSPSDVQKQDSAPVTTSTSDAIQNTLKQDTIKLEWHTDLSTSRQY